MGSVESRGRANYKRRGGGEEGEEVLLSLPRVNSRNLIAPKKKKSSSIVMYTATQPWLKLLADLPHSEHTRRPGCAPPALPASLFFVCILLPTLHKHQRFTMATFRRAKNPTITNDAATRGDASVPHENHFKITTTVVKEAFKRLMPKRRPRFTEDVSSNVQTSGLEA